MAKNGGFSQTLITQQGDSTALTGSTSPTTILHPAAVFTMPSNTLDTVGTKLRITASGRITNVVTSPGTLTFRTMFGAVIVADSGALALNIVAKTNVTWYLQWDLTVRAVGASTTATVIQGGFWASESVIATPTSATGGSGVLLLPASAPAVGTGFDSTASQAVNLFAVWGTNNANSILTHQYSLELLY